MKRTLVIATLVMLLLATTSVTAVGAELQQKGHSSIYTMNIAIGEKGVGTLVVNTEKHTWVLNAEGCDPGEQYWLYYTIDASRAFGDDTMKGRLGVNFGTGVATKDGALHMSGANVMQSGDPMTIDDLSTAAVTKFAAGYFTHDLSDPGSPYHVYVIYPWIIGSTKDVNWQIYHDDILVYQKLQSKPPFYYGWDLPLYYTLTITVTDSANRQIVLTWVPPT